jgi:hypothetical protein
MIRRVSAGDLGGFWILGAARFAMRGSSHNDSRSVLNTEESGGHGGFQGGPVNFERASHELRRVHLNAAQECGINEQAPGFCTAESNHPRPT